MSEDLFGGADQLDPAKALEHLQVPRTHRWEGTLRDMLDAVTHALTEPLGTEQAQRLAPAVVLTLCDTVGGSVCYLPRGAVLHQAIRDAQLFHDWRYGGLLPPALARKYRLAVQTVYEIIARQRELARRQEPDLFGFQDETGGRDE